MTDHAAVKAKLETQLKELLDRAADIENTLSAPGSQDWEENATESEDDEVMAGMGDVTRQEIQQVKLALSLIESGHYGKCTACGHVIGKDRLNAMPYTTKCIKCA